MPAARSEWHALSVDDVLDTLGASSAGLSSDEAATRLRAHGPNILPARRPPTLAAIVLHQFLSPLIYILLAAAAVALVLKDIRLRGITRRRSRRSARCATRRR